MNVLDQLTQTEKQLVTALPFRVGLYVSKADATGGDEADQQERRALETIIDGFAESVLGSEPIQYIMTETMRHKSNWPQWQSDLRNVPRECREAVDALGVHFNEKDRASFVNYMMQIGEAVAMAFREYEHLETPMQKFKVYSGYAQSFVQSVINKNQPRSLDEFLSVSMDERKALQKLAKAMYTHY